MKRTLFFLLFAALLITSAMAEQVKSVAPKVFAGWQLQSEEKSNDVAKADPANADLLKEYGFALVELAQYAKPGRSMTVKIARFSDASGAYGAYTFYRAPDMPVEDIGDMAASNNERILFVRGNLLVDAKLDRVTPMTAGELRELASLLPKESGAAANLPSITSYLPAQGMVPNTTKYILGPSALAHNEVLLPPQQVDFSSGAEITAADYKSRDGAARLLLISYPTPAIAGAKLRSIEQWHPAAAPGSSSAPSVWSKRTGRLVAVIIGNLSDGEAKTLLASVNYDADVTWNQNTHYDKKNNIGFVLVNIIALIAIIFGVSLVAGVAFGGVRILMKRMFPDRVFDRKEDVEIIRLNIGD
jgi:hypothetical protein